MTYLLDTNTLIQAKNEYYGYDICPGFWDWIDRENASQRIISIEPVLAELREGADDLTNWANERSEKLFLPIDPATIAALPTVVNWVNNFGFKEAATRDFLAKADPILIAYAMSHDDMTLATHEIHVQGERKKVKIPTVCRALGVPCIRTFGMLRNSNAKFELG